MSSFLEPEAVRFSMRDGVPTVHLEVEQSVVDSGTAGWSMLARPTMCVVDGPDAAGYLFPRLGPDGQDLAPPEWDAALTRAGGCLVAFGTNQAIFVPSAG